MVIADDRAFYMRRMLGGAGVDARERIGNSNAILPMTRVDGAFCMNNGRRLFVYLSEAFITLLL